MTILGLQNGQWTLAARPFGVTKDADFEFSTAPVSAPKEGQILVRNSLISVDLAPEGKGTKLVFTHEQLPTSASRDNHAKGWTGCLDRLANALAR